MQISYIAVAVVAALLQDVSAFSPVTYRPSSVSRNTCLHMVANYKSDLMGAQDMIDNILDKKNCGPIMVRLAWHDSGTYDQGETGDWPAAGGAVGSIRCNQELLHGANAGLDMAVDIMQEVKDKYPELSYADIYQMASARAIALAGGPDIDMRYGRLDSAGPEECSIEGHLPDAEAGPDGNYGGLIEGKPASVSTEDKTPNFHLRKVFYRMGLNDEEIVALSGAHTLGRAHKDRSGLGAEKTKFTDGTPIERGDGKKTDNYRVGGSAWTPKWLKFDNSYFTTMADEKADAELLKLSTDKTLFDDPGFKPFAEKFAADQDAFFESYAKAHKKLSELGSKFEPEGGIKL